MRKTHNVELNVLYVSSNIVRVIKSRRMRWASHVEFIGERRGFKVLAGKLREKTPLERPRRRWQKLLRLIFRKWGIGVWTGSNWLRIRTSGEHL